MDWVSIIKSGSISINGVKYSLEHLQKVQKVIQIPATDRFQAINTTLLISYSSHCVSYDPKTPDFDFDKIGQCYKIIDQHGICRVFDAERYECSKYLPAIFSDIVTKKCYQTINRNFFIIEVINDIGKTMHYHIYFRVKRVAKKLEIIVESAYPKDRALKSGDRLVRGSVLLAKMYRGEKIKQ